MDKLTELSRTMARDDCKSINVKKNGKWKEFVAIVRCKDCKYAEYWYRDKALCFLWNDDGIGVFEDGYCNYGERKDNAVE